MLVPTSLPAQCIDDGEYERHTTRKRLERGPVATPAYPPLLGVGPESNRQGQRPLTSPRGSAFPAAALCHVAMLASFPHRIRPAGIRGMAENGNITP
jgi:hypothetical protein